MHRFIKSLEGSQTGLLLIPAILIGGALVANAVFTALPAVGRETFGGPETVSASTDADGADTFVTASALPDDVVTIAGPESEFAGFIILESSAVFSGASPLAGSLPSRDGLLTYKIQKGDTLSSVAASFGISVNTILWANQGVRANALKIGQEVVILPVSGLVHRVVEGDTVDSISAQYNVSVDRILKFNKGLSRAGINQQTVIIPDAKLRSGASYVTTANLPSYPGYYAIPTKGWNWGQLHSYNGVDIANVCGTAVFASAEGLVVEAQGGWNGGYGKYVMIEHPNGTKSRYAHLEEINIEVGDYLGQGDVIGTMGNTGNVHGPTGCHLHFEAIGFKQPFAK